MPTKFGADKAPKAHNKENHQRYERTPVITEDDKVGLKGLLLLEQVDIFW